MGMERERARSRPRGVAVVVRAVETSEAAPDRERVAPSLVDMQFAVEARSQARTDPRFKRTFDVAFTLFVMIAGAPLFALLYVAVAFTSRGPAIYAHERVGRDGRVFRCYKFRTMVVDADRALLSVLLASPELAREFENGFKLRHDPRLTRLGAFLRRTSLDELPQFWNVLRGEMSVVGWRPLVAEEVPRYGTAFPVVARLRPGITGLWQVSGRNDLSYAERVRLDVRYARDAGMKVDLAILARTVVQMLHWSGNGAY